MKKVTGIIPALMLVYMIALGQDDILIQNPTFGIHFFFNDFKTPVYLRASSLATVLRNKQFGKIKDMESGLALNYLQGISKYFDFTTTLAGSFVDYPTQDNTFSGQDYFLLEGDASVRGKMFTNKYWFIPYIQIGAGVSTYNNVWGTFVPIGVGLQVSFFDEAYLLVNAQYRVPVTETTSYHFFYSIGLAGNLGKKKN